jgi:hypothetical protein
MPQVSPAEPPRPSYPPVIPPMPQTGAGTPYPIPRGPPVIPTTPVPFSQPATSMPMPPSGRYRPPSSASSPSESTSELSPDIRPQPRRGGRKLAPGQYGLRKWVLERPKTLIFNQHPLPPPPKDVFSEPPYQELLDSLRRTPEEILGYDPETTGFMVTPVNSLASREKKPRKGLFRAFGDKLKGKSRREREQQVPVMYSITQPVIFAPPQGFVPPLHDMYDVPRNPSPAPPPVSQPGATPGLMFAPMTSPSHTPVPPPPPSKSPAPSVRSRLYSPRPEPLKIDLFGELAHLTHVSHDGVRFRDMLYPTAFHALEAQRFTDTVPSIAEEIRRCVDVDQVRAVVSKHSDASRQDWDQIVLHVVSPQFIDIHVR